jgi:hypothetical protein
MPHVAPWFRREDYDRVREIMEDGNRFPLAFEKWEGTAKAQVEEAARHGVTIKPVILDPDEFLAFCKRKGLKPDNAARATFAISVDADIVDQ